MKLDAVCYMKDTFHFICQDKNIESEKISGLQKHDLKRLYLAKIPPEKKKNMDGHETAK